MCLTRGRLLQGLLADLRENRKKLDRKTADYDAARQKHLGYKTAAKAPSKWRKGDDPDRAHQLQQDMVHAQVSGEGRLLASASAPRRGHANSRVTILTRRICCSRMRCIRQ